MTAEPTAVERLRWIARTWTRWILVLALLLVGAAVGTSWTLGLFSSSSANPRNVVTAGSMTQDNSADNAAIMRVSGMVPGTVATGSATIENVGDARGEFVMEVTDVVDEPGPGGGRLSSRLRLTVYQDGQAVPVYRGKLDGFHVDLGVWTPGEEHTFEFEVELPESGPAVDNLFQRSRATATYVWNAVQSA